MWVPALALAALAVDPAMQRALSALQMWERSVQASARLAAQEPFVSQQKQLPWGTVNADGTLTCAKGYALKADGSPWGKQCYECPGGSYNKFAGSNMCNLCPAGRFSATVGRTTECDPCPANETSASGSTHCLRDGDVLTHSYVRPGTGGLTVWGRHPNKTLAQEVMYSPANATDCCYRQCAGQFAPPAQSNVGGDVAGDRQCTLGCRVWMRHSSLNWEAPKWRQPLRQKCRLDCLQAVEFGWHMWLKDAVTNTTECQSGCDAYHSCLDITTGAGR